jgi:hypothetical protein
MLIGRAARWPGHGAGNLAERCVARDAPNDPVGANSVRRCSRRELDLARSASVVSTNLHQLLHQSNIGR